MRPVRRLLPIVLWSLTVAACGESVNDCACTVSIGQESLTLGCGESGCVAGSRFGCDEDNVIALGRCGALDGASCLGLQAQCEPGASSCCPPDGGPAATCDAVSHTCCLPTGESCTTSAECCGGQACAMGAAGLRCSS